MSKLKLRGNLIYLPSEPSSCHNSRPLYGAGSQGADLRPSRACISLTLGSLIQPQYVPSLTCQAPSWAMGMLRVLGWVLASSNGKDTGEQKQREVERGWDTGKERFIWI